MLLSEAFSAVAAKNPNQAALKYLGKSISYAQLKNAIARLSYLYQKELGGKGKESRVAFLTHNSPAVITAFFALSNNRIPIIPMDPEAQLDELAEWLKASRATHIAVSSDLLKKARDANHSAHLNLPVIEIEKKQGGEYDTSFSAQSDHRPLDTDTVLIIKTRGYTGQPKFVLLNHKQIHHSVVGLRGLYRLTPAETLTGVLNWHQPFAIVHHMLLPIFMGATCLIDHGLINADYLDFMVEARVTRIIGVPSFFLKLLVICKNEKRLLPGIKAIIVGLGPLIPEVKKTFDLLKINVCHTYGATENVWTLAMEEFGEPSANPRNRGLAGLKYKVLDANGDEIEGGEIRRGPLCVSGPSVMSGYENLEKETKLKIRGTWLYTGDIAQLEGKDETLNITYLARREDYLERQGTPVSLSEIDRVVKKIRGIQDAGAFVLSRAVNINERVIAVAIVKATGSTVSEATILEACKTELSAHLTPDKIIFSDEIPRDLGGNVLGNRLRGLFAGAAG